MSSQPPNIVFAFGDQWRAQATGYAGDPNVRTPRLDALARQSVNLTRCIAGSPVCCPWRASFLTGQYPHEHGVFLNDIAFRPQAPTLGELFQAAGYQTAWIGKWHLDGHGRLSYIPPERRRGFEYWRAMECTHDYNNSFYYADSPERLMWDGYDAIAQTRDAVDFIHARGGVQPFFLALSWGPPHDPYLTAPDAYRSIYDPAALRLPPNVPEDSEAMARRDLAGYYAHCTALDDCTGMLLDALEREGLAENTVFVFTSDHGDMLGSQGQIRKQKPWDESIRVPFLVRWPDGLGTEAREVDVPVNTPDLLPTLLGLCGLPIPASIQGDDRSDWFRGTNIPDDEAAVIACYSPFGEWTRARGGREYRGVRTKRYTYVRTLDGPWLLYDNQHDPFQMTNLANRPETVDLQNTLDRLLNAKLEAIGDEFLPGPAYIDRWGYVVDESGTIPIRQ